jgi:hypothetical protein
MRQVDNSIGKKNNFGKPIKFNCIFFGTMDGDIVTVEEFVEGMFVKYINNDGVLCKNKNIDENLMKKAECFVH